MAENNGQEKLRAVPETILPRSQRPLQGSRMTGYVWWNLPVIPAPEGVAVGDSDT